MCNLIRNILKYTTTVRIHVYVYAVVVVVVLALVRVTDHSATGQVLLLRRPRTCKKWNSTPYEMWPRLFTRMSRLLPPPTYSIHYRLL